MKAAHGALGVRSPTLGVGLLGLSIEASRSAHALLNPVLAEAGVVGSIETGVRGFSGFTACGVKAVAAATLHAEAGSTPTTGSGCVASGRGGGGSIV